MDEFLNIQWKDKKTSQLELLNIQEPFLIDSTIDSSYVLTHLDGSSQTENVNFFNFEDEQIVEKRHCNYIPGKVNKPKQNFPKSRLNKWQQMKCLNAIKLLSSKKCDHNKLTEEDKFYLKIYEECRYLINEENSSFLEYTKQMWINKKKQKLTIKPALYNYGYYMLKNQWKRYYDYPNFFKKIDIVSSSYTDEEAPIEMTHLQNILELGKVAKFTPPTFKNPLILKPIMLPDLSQEVLYNSKLSVSKDGNVKKILTTSSVDVVISSSVLKRILDNTDSTTNWYIPFCIEKIKTGVHNPIEKKVVFLDKPLLKTNPNHMDLYEKCYKLLIKTNLCKFEALSYPNLESEISNTSSKKTEIEGGNITSECCAVKEVLKNPNNTSKVHHNVTYNMWNLKQNYDDVCKLMKTKNKSQEFKILVRCKIDACEQTDNGTLIPLVVLSKMEYQLEYGGEIATKSQLSREWTSLFFRPYSNSYRVHINVNNSEVVSIEQSNMHKVNTEAFSYYKYKPHLGLGTLYKIIERASKLEVGNYLLHHSPQQGPFVTIYQNTNENGQHVFDLHAEVSSCSFDEHFIKPWCPIDVNVVLPMHIAYKRMPGMFPPTNEPFKKNKKMKKRKINKIATL